MVNIEEYINGKSLDELLNEARQEELGKERSLVRIGDKNGLVNAQNDGELLLRIKDEKGNVVFERFYDELLSQQGNGFIPAVSYLFRNFGLYKGEDDLLDKLGRAYYAMQKIYPFPYVFNLLADCDSSFNHLSNIAYSPRADYKSFAVQFQGAFDSYESFFPRILPLKIGKKVRTIKDELTDKRVASVPNHSFSYGSILEVTKIFDTSGIALKNDMSVYSRYELEIIEPDPRNIDAFAFRVLRRNIEEKLSKARNGLRV